MPDTRAEPEAGMHSEHPGATYQSGARSRYALRASRSCIHMHPKNLSDAYRKKGPKAVHKRLYPEREQERMQPRARELHKAVNNNNVF